MGLWGLRLCAERDTDTAYKSGKEERDAGKGDLVAFRILLRTQNHTYGYP